MKLPVDYLNNLDDKQYGILMSGGLDSSVLFALIVKLNPNVRIQPFTVMKPDGSYKFVDNIIASVNEKFGTSVPHTIMIDNPPNMYHRQYGKYATKYIFDNYREIERLFNGLNQNPEELSGYNGAPDRSKSETDLRIIAPFIEYTKETVVEMMFEHDLEWLSDITHSCTRYSVGRCGVCFQCQERRLAYAINGKTDTGVE